MPINYSKYPPNWKTAIRPRILKRAENCCEKCGVSNYSEGVRTKEGKFVPLDEYHIECQMMSLVNFELKYDRKPNKIIKIVLTIAHLDHDETNWSVTDERLMAMCQRCHLRYDAPEKARRKREKNQQQKLF